MNHGKSHAGIPTPYRAVALERETDLCRRESPYYREGPRGNRGAGRSQELAPA